MRSSIEGGLKPVRLTEMLKHIKREDTISALTTVDDTVLQGFTTVGIASTLKYDMEQLAKLIAVKFDPTIEEAQSFHVVTEIGDKFSFLIMW